MMNLLKGTVRIHANKKNKTNSNSEALTHSFNVYIMKFTME